MLANHANGNTGQCNPSHRRLADVCEMGSSTLRKHILELEKCGLLTIVPKFVDGVQLPNQYNLHIDGCSNQAEGMPDTSMGVCSNRAPNKQEEKTVNKPESVSKEIWENFLSLRKQHKAPVTALIIRNIIAEADKARWTLEKAMEEICVRGWRSFKAEWVMPKKTFVEIKVDKDRMEYERMMGRGK
jgi:hypothetical protein